MGRYVVNLQSFGSKGAEALKIVESDAEIKVNLRRYVVCDLQGGMYSDEYVLTDPALLSSDKEFGPTDLGQKGIDNFFMHHKCGRWCQPNWRRPASKPSVPHLRPVKGTCFIMR